MGKRLYKSTCKNCTEEFIYNLTAAEGIPLVCYDCMPSTSEFNTQVKQLCNQLADLLIDKRAVYGNNIDNSPELLKLLYPEGIKPEQYSDLLLITRTLDKISRLANNSSTDSESPWLDIAGYAILGLLQDQE